MNNQGRLGYLVILIKGGIKMVKSIKEVLMRRDGISEVEADELISDAKEDLASLLEAGDMEAAERICEDWFGLEPDYLTELF